MAAGATTMAEAVGRDWVRQRIQTELAAQGWNISDLAREAGVDAGTVGDFLNGSRWPQVSTRSKIAIALNWDPDSLALMERNGGEPTSRRETVRPDTHADDVLLSLPPEALAGLGPAEREEVIAAARLSALRAAREIRRRVDDEADQRR